IFTPATKAATGHDENISFERAASLIGKELAEKVRAVSLEIYRRAAAYAEPRGVILADTKFEFGILYHRARGRAAADDLMWIDEAVGEFEKRFIKRVLDRANGNQSRAAEILGIHRNTLSRKIDEYKLDSNGHRRYSR